MTWQGGDRETENGRDGAVSLLKTADSPSPVTHGYAPEGRATADGACKTLWVAIFLTAWIFNSRSLRKTPSGLKFWAGFSVRVVWRPLFAQVKGLPIRARDFRARKFKPEGLFRSERARKIQPLLEIGRPRRGAASTRPAEGVRGWNAGSSPLSRHHVTVLRRWAAMRVSCGSPKVDRRK